MNFRERLAKLELDIERAELNGSEELGALRTQHAEMMIAAWDTAYERACELDSPNSIGFDRLHESIYEELVS